jgi:hypothetical protein
MHSTIAYFYTTRFVKRPATNSHAHLGQQICQHSTTHCSYTAGDRERPERTSVALWPLASPCAQSIHTIGAKRPLNPTAEHHICKEGRGRGTPFHFAGWYYSIM